jgi:hypothetical protein
MDFDGAIKAHTSWMIRLFSYSRGTSKETLDFLTIQKDNLCDLGKWLHGEGRKYATHPEFGELVRAHASFHRSAASILELIDQGKNTKAEQLLTAIDSDYRQQSFEVIGLLKKLQRMHGAA